MKIFISIIFLFIAVSCNAKENQSNNNLILEEKINSLKISKKNISILIDKSDYKLYIKANNIVLKEYPVVFGENTLDDKLIEGDKCTPEGKFNIIDKYPHKNWSKFIWLNYPNNDSWKKHNKAKNNGIIPKKSKIGGEVGIHGVPKGMDSLIDEKENWTLGCVSLKNKDINEIYPFITKNTIIEIRK